MNMDMLALYRTFVRVVEAGSFSAVALELNTSQPTISRQVAQLEEHLGARLFQRTTRALTLTDDGQVLYGQAVRVLESVAETEASVGRGAAAPSGLLRLGCPVVFGRRHIVPRLGVFLARHPRVSIALAMQDSYVDLIEEGIDLAIRVGEVRDPSLVARRIGTTRRVLVASPDYLARRGVPAHPADLPGHDCATYSGTPGPVTWHFRSPAGPLSVTVTGRFRTGNSEGVREAVLAGLGIGLVPIWHFGDEIDTGRLVILLPEFEPPSVPTSAVYPSRRFLAPKVRAMIDFLAHEFSLDPRLSDVR